METHSHHEKIGGRILFKILLCGDGAVGKTTLRRCYFGKSLDRDYVMTIGADFSVKREIINGKELTFQIWDLAGQQRFERVRSNFFLGAKGVLMVFDLTRPESFINISNWLNELQLVIKTVVPFTLVGNKVDIRDKVPGITITSEQGQRYAEQLTKITKDFGFTVNYYETCALDGRNVNSVFTDLGKKIMGHFDMG